MDLREILAGIAGVWEGTYTVLGPDGTVLERFGSRQEARLDGDRWHERIIYLREGQEPEVHDFQATITPDAVFDDPDFEGTTAVVDDRILVFPYRWRARPDEEIVETIVLASRERRSRVWQHVEDGHLARLTVIEEQRRGGP